MAARDKNGLEAAAKNIGSALGHLAGRLDALNKQRADIAAELKSAIARGQSLLASLGVAAEEAPKKNKGGRPKGYKMSDATRAKLRAAWKKRKEAAASGREQTKPADTRAAVRSADGRKWTNRQAGRG